MFVILRVLHCLIICCFFVEGYGDHRDLHVLTHSFPTRRSSDLGATRPGFAVTLDAAPTLPGIAAALATIEAVLVTLLDNSRQARSEEHTSELQSLMRNSYAVFCLKKITLCLYILFYFSSLSLQILIHLTTES